MIVRTVGPPPLSFPAIKTVGCLVLCSLLALLLPGCSSEPPTPRSADEEAQRAENKAAEHRVFYEGWLHPS